MLDHDIGENAAAHIPFGGQAREAGGGGGDNVVKNGVAHFFMERALVTVAPCIQLQALELDALFVRYIVEQHGGEIGLPGERAQAGEFRNLHVDVKVPLGRRIRKCIEFLAWFGGHCGRLVKTKS